ncbi:glycosyltransferase [Limnohabitans sp.]|uniref:glycosyltransferase n=1 Tax=Limnohabitans sp. TaxID=1907725 RepID=UPI0025BD4482|nr:glycosyltransferase [Limnohabitans sp.]
MANPRHLLLLTEESGVGGVQTTLHWLESGLAARGWQVTRLPVRRGRPSLWACWQAARRAQVLVASNNFRPAYAAVALAWLARRPSVVWVHGPLHEVLQQAGASRLKTGWLRAVYRRASQLVCASQTSCDSLLRVMKQARPDAGRAMPSRMRVIRNPAVLPGAGQDDAAMPVTMPATEVIALGFVGRLSPEKQPLQLLPMLRLLPAACQLHVVGDGELMDAMRSAGQDLLAQGRLHLHGQQTVSAQTYRAWRATVLCSRYEGYPMTALESLACGVPCVSTPIPAMQEMLGTQAPLWLAHDESPAALAEAVQRCLAQAPADRQAAIDQLQQQHRLETFVQAWDHVLTGLLQRLGKGSGQGPRQGHGAEQTEALRDDSSSGGRP